MGIDEIKKLDVKERIILMNEIWETLDSESIDSPSWHKDIIEERINKINNDQAKFITLKDLKTK